jgi:hypothetical protein
MTTLNDVFASIRHERMNQWSLSSIEDDTIVVPSFNVSNSNHATSTNSTSAKSTNKTKDKKEETYVDAPGKMNVLLGRGRHHIQHPGNAYLINLVKLRSNEFGSVNKREKRRIVEEIFDKVIEKGSFIRYDRASQSWVEVSQNYALEKISQALRYRHKCQPLSDVNIQSNASVQDPIHHQRSSPPPVQDSNINPSSPILEQDQVNTRSSPLLVDTPSDGRLSPLPLHAPNNHFASVARPAQASRPNRAPPLLSDQEILRAVGYKLCPITGIITPLDDSPFAATFNVDTNNEQNKDKDV